MTQFDTEAQKTPAEPPPIKTRQPLTREQIAQLTIDHPNYPQVRALIANYWEYLANKSDKAIHHRTQTGHPYSFKDSMSGFESKVEGVKAGNPGIVREGINRFVTNYTHNNEREALFDSPKNLSDYMLVHGAEAGNSRVGNILVPHIQQAIFGLENGQTDRAFFHIANTTALFAETQKFAPHVLPPVELFTAPVSLPA